MAKIEYYVHHNMRVAVQEHLRGQHREHCLCYQCASFTPKDRETNCPIAALLYRFCILTGCTTPVWECPDFLAGTTDPEGTPVPVPCRECNKLLIPPAKICVTPEGEAFCSHACLVAYRKGQSTDTSKGDQQ